jgi:hypothetical protein
MKQKANLLSVKGRTMRLYCMTADAGEAGIRDPALIQQPELVHVERALRSHLAGHPQGTQALLENMPNVAEARVSRTALLMLGT